MKVRKPQLTHEERMAEIRLRAEQKMAQLQARAQQESRMLQLLAEANIDEEELVEILASRAKAEEAARIAAKIEAETRSAARARAEEIIARLGLHQMNNGDGYVYFVETLDGEHLKIGYTGQPDRRLMQLTRASWKKVNVIGYIRGTLELEHALHLEFAAERSNGEWFEFSAMLKEFLNVLSWATPELRRNALGHRLRDWR